MTRKSFHLRKTFYYCLFTSVFVVLAFCYAAVSEEKGENTIERKYAPDRKVDILHITIDVTPNFKERSIVGTTTIKFAPIAKSLTELRLDAFDLLVSSVTSGAKVAGYNVTDKDITITFDPPIEPGAETTVTIKYSACPKRRSVFQNAGTRL